MIRRVVGVVFILLGVMGLAICYMGARSGRAMAGSLADSLDSALASTSETLDTVEQTLEHSRQTVDSINKTVAQVQTTTSDLSAAIDDTQPLLGELALLVGESIPATISDVQNTIPNIAQSAKVVDDTLRLLSKLQIEETVPIINYKINIGLGVDYNPEVAFDQAIEEVGRGLDPIAQASSNLESDLNTTGVNMAVLSQDLIDLADELGKMNGDLADFRPLLDEYSFLVEKVQADLAGAQARLYDQLATVKQGIILVAIWLGLFQLLPIYFGVELALGNRMVPVADETSPVRAAGTNWISGEAMAEPDDDGKKVAGDQEPEA